MGDSSSPISIGTGVTGAPKSVDAGLYLRAQLNRFTAAGGAPLQLRFATNPLPLVAGPVDADTANRALFVINMRAGYASAQQPSEATQKLLATYGSAWSNPVGYVTANLPIVTDVVRLFADSQNIPAAKGVPTFISIPFVGEVSTTTALAGAAALAGAIYLTRRRRRR